MWIHGQNHHLTLRNLYIISLDKNKKCLIKLKLFPASCLPRMSLSDIAPNNTSNKRNFLFHYINLQSILTKHLNRQLKLSTRTTTYTPQFQAS